MSDSATAKSVGLFIMALASVVLVSLLMAYPVKWMINDLFMPAVLVGLFGGPLSVGKSWLLSALCHWLFKSSNSSK